MLPESYFKKKSLLLVLIFVFLYIKPSECKATSESSPQSSNQKSLPKNNSVNSLIVGVSDFNALRKQRSAFEGRVEFRSSLSLLIVQPLAGITFTSSGAFYGMAGFYFDISLSNNIIFTPSFSAGYFSKGEGHDLAYKIEFRTLFEIFYSFENNSKIGIGFDHISNGSLGKSNPGAESISFIYSIPMG